tara:strand:+ start:1056 stop:1277 length:222 start_codon:yes stop_codon:yes gene_type:complete
MGFYDYGDMMFFGLFFLSFVAALGALCAHLVWIKLIRPRYFDDGSTSISLDSLIERYLISKEEPTKVNSGSDI